MPSITIESGRATEAEYVIFTLRLSEPSLDAVTVDYATFSGTADRSEDVGDLSGAPQFGTVTFAPGQTVQTVEIFVNRDYVDERDESFFLELRNPSGATFQGRNATLSAVGWALDNDGVGSDRAMAVSQPVVTEGTGTASFTISLSEPFDTDRTFSFETYDGSARAGSDYVARTGTVTFLAGQTEVVVTVNLMDDASPEATESFGLRVNGAHGITGSAGTAHILDTDAAQPVISIEGSGATEAEYMFFTVRLSEASTDAVTMDYDVRSGTALRDDDLGDLSGAPLSGTVTFAPGETVQTVAIYVGRDYEDEIDESFFLELRNPSGATFGPGNSSLTGIGWALDNDGVGLNRSVAVSGAEMREGPGGRAAVFAVEISTPSDVAITLNFQTVAGTALAGSDFVARSGQITFAPGQTRIEIPVTLLGDLALEGTEQFYLRVAPPFPGQISSRTSIATGTATIHDGTLRGTAGNDVLQGTAWAERIEGYAGNDLLIGAGGNDLLAGGAGNDTLNGGAGRDQLIGGTGNDTYLADASDIIIETANGGIDRVASSETIRLAEFVENLVLTGTGNINGTGNSLANILQGNAGRNVLTGGYGNDTYILGAGDTAVERVTAGYDTVQSNVSQVLGANIEALQLLGIANANGTGNALANRLIGNSGNNVLDGMAGNDVLLGGLGNDALRGGDGADILQGGAGADLLSGGNGADNLQGGAGRDNLQGGMGSDTLVGGTEADVLTGGADRDVFVFNMAAESRLGLGRDRIADFQVGVDDIDLRGMDPFPGIAGNQAFAFSGTTAAANSVWFVQQSTGALVRGDVNGDGYADFEIMLTGVARVTANDFLL
ncbi:Calx-beta domain-containing protein [Paracoccus laeviglucosivorans]|uniref:Hemolysin-type calcium-binding repeat-containing protein n=1 Tax=Paracoccus laeviglucosivorans TaxID=1197861 RepID=A0A521FCN3_9RHOB|nr:Calx-beta domain-containing protein [Paracoccus laeviglucosivorans]SMO93958.1 Hemolysin-type calcium-binding repeat-containing protein [Paracoccus laeviglucosivorans]